MGSNSKVIIPFLIILSSFGLTAEAEETPAKIGLEKTKLVLQNGCQHTKKVFRCVEYLRNYDGDTLAVNIPGLHPLFGKNIRVRVRGIDTAEIQPRGKCKGPTSKACFRRQKCERRLAQVAQKELQKLLSSGKRLEIHDAKRGNYFRILGTPIVDGTNISDWMLARGYAVPYRRKGLRTDWCEVEARILKRSKNSSSKPKS